MAGIKKVAVVEVPKIIFEKEIDVSGSVICGLVLAAIAVAVVLWVFPPKPKMVERPTAFPTDCVMLQLRYTEQPTQASVDGNMIAVAMPDNIVCITQHMDEHTLPDGNKYGTMVSEPVVILKGR